MTWDEEALLERIATLKAERDEAREDAGVQAHFRAFHRGEAMRYLQGLMLARDALVATGYFTADECKGLDIAPRITEMWNAPLCSCGKRAVEDVGTEGRCES